MRRIKELFIFFAVMLIPVWVLMFVGLLFYFLVKKPASSGFWDVLPPVAVGSLAMTILLLPVLFVLLGMYAEFQVWRANLVEDLKECTDQNNDR